MPVVAAKIDEDCTHQLRIDMDSLINFHFLFPTFLCFAAFSHRKSKPNFVGIQAPSQILVTLPKIRAYVWSESEAAYKCKSQPSHQISHQIILRSGAP